MYQLLFPASLLKKWSKLSPARLHSSSGGKGVCTCSRRLLAPCTARIHNGLHSGVDSTHYWHASAAKVG